VFLRGSSYSLIICSDIAIQEHVLIFMLHCLALNLLLFKIVINRYGQAPVLHERNLTVTHINGSLVLMSWFVLVSVVHGHPVTPFVQRRTLLMLRPIPSFISRLLLHCELLILVNSFIGSCRISGIRG